MKHMQHLFTVLLLLSCSIASAYDFTVDGIYYNILSGEDKTVEVTKGDNDYTGDVTVPNIVTFNDVTYNVTSIREYAFSDCSGLTSIEIPSSVIIIGESAFSGCNNLSRVTIGNKAVAVFENAFYGTAWKRAEEEGVFMIVENQPEFPGGMKALIKYLQENIKYPSVSRSKYSQGRTYVRFVINTDGSIQNIEVYKSSGDIHLDIEAVRVVNSMPKWNPGRQSGKAVRTCYTCPVVFRLK